MATIAGAIIQSAGLRPGASGILFQSDAAADIGAPAANRPRDVHVGRNLAVAGSLAVSGTANPIAAITNTTAGPLLVLTGSTSNGASQRFLLSNGTKYNWVVGAQLNVDDGFEITPSTAAGGTTFSIPALSVKRTGQTSLNQGAEDGEILSLRSSDVAHGMTSLTDTDTFGVLKKNSPTGGGFALIGYSEGTGALSMIGRHTTDDTTKSGSSGGAVNIEGLTKSGTTTTAMGANGNILTIGNGTAVRFILDADGDSHQDVGTAWTNFDTHDDVALLNHFAAKVTRRDDPLRKGFGRWLRKNREELERTCLVTFNRDGHHFVNMSRLTMLHTGAIRQMGARLEQLEEALRFALIGKPERAQRILTANV